MKKALLRGVTLVCLAGWAFGPPGAAEASAKEDSSAIRNGSFDGRYMVWGSSASTSGKTGTKMAVDKTAAVSGSHSGHAMIRGNGTCSWHQEWVPLTPNTIYQLSAFGKNTNAGGFISFVVEDIDHKKTAEYRENWAPDTTNWTRKSIVFSTKNTDRFGKISLTSSGQGEGDGWWDDVVLESVDVVAMTSKRVAVLTDAPAHSTVVALAKLFPGEVQVLDINEPLNWNTIIQFSAVLTLVTQPENSAKISYYRILEFARPGRIVIAGLDEYAAWRKLDVNVYKEPDKTQVPDLPPEKLQALSKGAETISALNIGPQAQGYVGHLPEPWMDEVATQLLAEVERPIPSIQFQAADNLVRGFSPGQTLYWCGRSDGQWEQRQLKGTLPKDALCLAVSTVNQQPVFVKQKVGQGCIYAIDLLSLNEPNETWETRGSFNKYLFPANVLGAGIRYGGHHWNKKPTYEEIAAHIREVAAKYPGILRLGTEGFQNGYNTLSLTIGDERKPMWLALGMYHADDEWISALGLIDFAAYIAEHRNDPAIKDRLSRMCLKVVPIQSPALYMRALRGGGSGGETKVDDPPAKNGFQYDIATLWEVHSCDGWIDRTGVNVLTAEGWKTMPAIAQRHLQQARGRFIRWDPQSGPHQMDEISNNGYQPFYRFYAESCYNHLYHYGMPQMAFCDYIYAIETGRAAQRPAQFHQNVHLRVMVWQEPTYKLAILSDDMVDWALSAFLESPPAPYINNPRTIPNYSDNPKIQLIQKESQKDLPR